MKGSLISMHASQPRAGKGDEISNAIPALKKKKEKKDGYIDVETVGRRG